MLQQNTRDILNAQLYPQPGDNIRRKDTPYFDTVTIAAGVQEYYFFVTALGNPFARNKKLPLSGSEIFFVDIIKLILAARKVSTTEVNVLCELLQQCYLQISVDNREMMKLPLLDILQYELSMNEDATPEILRTKISLMKRQLPLPIILNSTSAFEFKLWVTTAVATALDGVDLELVLEGLQNDKLISFTWDQVKNSMFQQLSYTLWETQSITTGNQVTYNFFANAAAANNLISKIFPLSDIETFSAQSMEIFIGQPDTPIVPSSIYNSSLNKIVSVVIDDVEYLGCNLADRLSVVGSIAGNLTDSNADTTAYVNVFEVRQQYVFRVPLEFPANGKVSITLTQPAGSLPVTGEITFAFRGILTRRLA